MKVTVGFDPGKDGAFAILTDTPLGAVPFISGFAFVGDELDLAQILMHMPADDPEDNILIVIEKVHAMPKQGVTSMFTFGSGYGELKALAKMTGFRYELVPPQTWKRAVLAGTDKSKGSTVEWAVRTYPKLQHQLMKKSGLAHMGKVDALAIAHYGHYFAQR